MIKRPFRIFLVLNVEQSLVLPPRHRAGMASGGPGYSPHRTGLRRPHDFQGPLGHTLQDSKRPRERPRRACTHTKLDNSQIPRQGLLLSKQEPLSGCSPRRCPSPRPSLLVQPVGAGAWGLLQLRLKWPRATLQFTVK